MITKIILLLSLISLSGCSLYKDMVSLPKYRLSTSVKGANVYNSKGRLLGQTPMILAYKDIKDSLDGEFVTLILEKESYLSRVVFFESERSVELKIDLKRDEFFENNRYRLLEGRYELASKENLFLKEKIKSTEDILDKRKVESVEVKPTIERAKIKQVISKPISIEKNKKSYKPIRKKNVNLSSSVINKFFIVQNLINKRNFKQAIHNLFEIDRKYPDLTTTLNLLTYIELEKGNYNTAKVYLKRITALKRSDVMTKRLYLLLNKLEGVKEEEITK